jgi:hypothetical protein
MRDVHLSILLILLILLDDWRGRTITTQFYELHPHSRDIPLADVLLVRQVLLLIWRSGVGLDPSPDYSHFWVVFVYGYVPFRK